MSRGKTVTGQLSRSNPHLRRYLSTNCFRGKETVGTRVSSFPFSYLTRKEIKLVLLSLAIVTLGSCSQLRFRKVQERQQNVYARFNCDMKINEKVIKQINPFLASYYVG